MNETKFTPAPWHIQHGSQSTEIYAGKEWICEIGSERLRDDANAALIAQAPAMYAAMQSFCTDFENDYVMEDGRIVDNPQNILVVNYNAFQSILAAARGESHKKEQQ